MVRPSCWPFQPHLLPRSYLTLHTPTKWNHSNFLKCAMCSYPQELACTLLSAWKNLPLPHLTNSDSSCKSQLRCHFLRKASLTFQRLLPPTRYLSGVALVTAAALPAFPVQAFPDKNASYAGSFSSLISIWLFLCKIFNRPLLRNGKHPPSLAWHSSWLLLRCWPVCFPSIPLLPSLSTTLCHVYPNPIKVKQPLRSNSTHTYSLKPAFISGGKRTSYGSINPYFFPSLDSQISQSLYPSPHQPFFHYPTNWHLLHQN